jgi:hypothetical protein
VSWRLPELRRPSLVELPHDLGDPPVAVAREGTAGAPAPDSHPRRASRLRTWSRFRSDARLAALMGERFPGLGFRGLEVVAGSRHERVRPAPGLRPRSPLL